MTNFLRAPWTISRVARGTRNIMRQMKYEIKILSLAKQWSEDPAVVTIDTVIGKH